MARDFESASKRESLQELSELAGNREQEEDLTIKFNWFKILTYSWMDPMFHVSRRKSQLEHRDLFLLPARHTASHLADQQLRSWQAFSSSSRQPSWRHSFWLSCFWPHRFHILLCSLLIVVESAQRILSAFVLRQLIRFLQSPTHMGHPISYGYIMAALLGLLAFAFPFLHHQIWFRCQVIGWNLRVASMTAINHKLLHLNGNSLARITTGHCINLMSNDVRRFDELPMFAQFLWAAPLELAVVLTLIALELGVAPAFAGVGALLALIPLQTLFGHLFAKQRRKTVGFTDARVKMTGEVLAGILAVKMFAWEAPFTSLIQSIRNQERRTIEGAAYIKAFNEAAYFSSSAVVSLITFLTFSLLGGTLQASSVFYVLSLIQLPRLWMCVFFPAGIAQVAEATVSFARLQAFMELPNSDRSDVRKSPTTDILAPLPHTAASNIAEDTHQHLIGSASFQDTAPAINPFPPADSNASSFSTAGDALSGGGGDVCVLKDVTFGWESVHEEGGKAGDKSGTLFQGKRRRQWMRSLGHGGRGGHGGRKHGATNMPAASSHKADSALQDTEASTTQEEAAASQKAASPSLAAASAAALSQVVTSSSSLSSLAAAGEAASSGVLLEECVRGVSFSLGPTELLAIAGPVGCGKTTLLSGILGDALLCKGQLTCNAQRIAYAAQKPFIISGSIRDNITFGLPFTDQLYNKVVAACALERDIAHWPAGHNTEIGERGVNLSGGQKARVGLARAAYASSLPASQGGAQLVLLDDPLSAVDPAVGAHIFQHCIVELMGGKPRILVTHQLQYLPKCDRVLLLSTGSVAGLGPYDKLSSHVDVESLLVTTDEGVEGEGEKASKGGSTKDKSLTTTVGAKQGRNDQETRDTGLLVTTEGEGGGEREGGSKGTNTDSVLVTTGGDTDALVERGRVVVPLAAADDELQNHSEASKGNGQVGKEEVGEQVRLPREKEGVRSLKLDSSTVCAFEGEEGDEGDEEERAVDGSFQADGMGHMHHEQVGGENEVDNMQGLGGEVEDYHTPSISVSGKEEGRMKKGVDGFVFIADGVMDPHAMSNAQQETQSKIHEQLGNKDAPDLGSRGGVPTSLNGSDSKERGMERERERENGTRGIGSIGISSSSSRSSGREKGSTSLPRAGSRGASLSRSFSRSASLKRTMSRTASFMGSFVYGRRSVEGEGYIDGGRGGDGEDVTDIGKEEDEQEEGALVAAETRQKGTVSLSVYTGYAASFGFLSAFLVFALLSLAQALVCTSDWFLAYWSQHATQPPHFFRSLYSVLVCCGTVASFACAGLYARSCVTAASRIHASMLAHVLASPLSFFHSQPIGRVLNRFSADQGIMDDLLPQTQYNYLQTLFLTLAALVMVCVGVPWTVFLLLILLFFFLRLRSIFLTCSREAKRLEAVARSHVYAHYAATIQGLSTIRAFGAESVFQQRLFASLDYNGRPFFVWLAASRWLAFRLDSLVAFVVLAASLLAVALRSSLPPALVALSLSYTLQLSGLLQWAVRQGAEVENLFTGVERALEYTRLPGEEDNSSSKHTATNHPSNGTHAASITHSSSKPQGNDSSSRTSSWASQALKMILVTLRMGGTSSGSKHNSTRGSRGSRGSKEGKGWRGSWRGRGRGSVDYGSEEERRHLWPSQGCLRVERLTVCYRRNSPPVLNGVSFELQGGEKCGIVGRTGAGKSTLMLALFRLVNISEGRIVIDDVDAAMVSLSELRRSVMAIPQDPALFGSSLRFNLDPFREYSDAALWLALESVQLGSKVKQLAGGLSAGMAEFGGNFSSGQRQLLCLARAILHRNHILVMDEATANVDLATDVLIQQTIREQFVSCTVLTIAHRMDTIIDADKVVVLERGRVVEFASPSSLLADPSAVFSKMVGVSERHAAGGGS